MSNYLAIASVTAALRDLLQEAVGLDEPGARVTTARPDDSISGTPETRVNIYLYQVTPNAGWRNAHVPTRRADGSFIQRPQVALDLHYMITFYGDESQLMSQRMLGSVVRVLDARPVLSRDRIHHTVTSAVDSGTFPFLANSDLADGAELVKFSPLHLSLEEQSKIWSVFFQIPYVLSVAYQATVVLIESNDMVQEALPVRGRTISAPTFQQPRIERVSASEGVNAPITVDSTLSITGQGLLGDTTLVRIGGGDVPLDVDTISETKITLLLSVVVTSLQAIGATLQAGVQGLQVVQQVSLGSPPVLHSSVESDVAAFVLHPIIVKTNGNYDISTANVQGTGDSPRSADITIKNIRPATGKSQRIILMLNEYNPNPGQPLQPPGRLPRSYSFEVSARNQAGAPDTSDSITIPVINVLAGSYLVRIQVDGATSLLDVNAEGRYAAPQVTIP